MWLRRASIFDTKGDDHPPNEHEQWLFDLLGELRKKLTARVARQVSRYIGDHEEQKL